MTSHSDTRLITITFDIVAAFVFVLLLLLILTAVFSTKITRRGCWFNFMVPTALYPAAYLLQLGEQAYIQPPSNALCIMQALLIYALPVYAITGFICFMWESYLCLYSTFPYQGSDRTLAKPSKIILIIPPFAFVAVLIAEILLIFLLHEIRDSIGFSVGGIYCHVSHRLLTFFIGAVYLSLFCAWFYIYAMIIMLLKTRWSFMATCEAWRRRLLVRSAIRITLITAAVCLGIILCIISLTTIPSEDEQPVSTFQYLALPLTVLLIFGTQTDILQCWTCGRFASVPHS